MISLESEQNTKKTKSKFIFIIVALLLILFVLNYFGLSEKLFKSSVGLKVTCTQPSCNPSNNQQYCLNGKWNNCNNDQTCVNGGCVNQFANPSSSEANNGVNSGSSGGSKYALTVIKAGNGFGTVNTGDEVNCDLDSNQCTTPYHEVTKIVLTAVPSVNSAFGGWSGCDSQISNTCTINIDSAKSVTATFNFIPESH